MLDGKRWVFDVEVVNDNGHLHAELTNAADRKESIRRMQRMLEDSPTEWREGLVQILTDQAEAGDMHPPLILSVGAGDEIRWHCHVGHGNFAVEIDEYPNPSGGTKTPKKGKPHKDLYKFGRETHGSKQKSRPKGTPVTSGGFEDPAIALDQKFYKFSVTVDGLGDLDPCIICEP